MPSLVTKTMTAAAIAAVMTGCAVQQPAKIVTPPAPTPAPIQDPPVVIATQTVARLPDPQPIPPESLRQEPAPEPAPPESQPARPPRRSNPQQSRPREPEPAPQPAENAPTTAAPVIRTGPALISSESSVAAHDIETRIADVRARIQRISSRSTSKESQLTEERIASFLKLAEDSLARNDLRQANLQSSRALTLVQDLER